MPEISRFLGIVIGMFYTEHGLPHFHAVYGGFEATRGLAPGACWRVVGPDSAAGVAAMNYHVLEAHYVVGNTVWLRFADGTAGEVDLEPALRGPVFEPLRDPACLRHFAIHPEFHTLVWPNGADIAPEWLHAHVRVAV